MSDDITTRRAVMRDGLPTPRGLRAAAAFVADASEEAAPGRRDALLALSGSLYELAERLPALLTAEREARRWRKVVAMTKPVSVSMCGFAAVRCCTCGMWWFVNGAETHDPDCQHVAALSECRNHRDTGGGE